MGGYSGDMVWKDWVFELNMGIPQLNQALEMCMDRYRKWYDFSYGKTNAELATALGKTEADIAKMQSAYGTFKKMYDLFNGTDTLADAYDYKATLLPF